jgi:hypothetical protein
VLFTEISPLLAVEKLILIKIYIVSLFGGSSRPLSPRHSIKLSTTEYISQHLLSKTLMTNYTRNTTRTTQEYKNVLDWNCVTINIRMWRSVLLNPLSYLVLQTNLIGMVQLPPMTPMKRNKTEPHKEISTDHVKMYLSYNHH